MGEFFKELNKHLHIFFIFMKNCLIGQLEYRANFITGMMMEIGYLFAKVLYIIVIYRAGVRINGLSPDEILVFIGTYVIATAFFAGLYMINLYSMSEHVRTGTLDFYITKPVSLQFMLTFRRSDISLLIIDLAAGIPMVVIGLVRLGEPVHFLSLMGFAGYLLAGSVVGYALFLIPHLMVFKLVNISGLGGVMDSFWDFNNMPMGIYTKMIQRIGIFIIPIFTVSNLPAMFILGKMDTAYALWGIAAPFIFMFISRILWKKAIKGYTSASS